MIFYIFEVVEDSSRALRIFFIFIACYSNGSKEDLLGTIFSHCSGAGCVSRMNSRRLEETRHPVQLCDSFICFY